MRFCLNSLYLFSLFLNHYHVTRYFHSFPTRRSSDLALGREDLLANDGWLPRLKERFSPTDSVVDRKSTRLNSSHVSISYAVFCLKKKKDNRTARASAEDSSPSDPRMSTHSPRGTSAT